MWPQASAEDKVEALLYSIAPEGTRILIHKMFPPDRGRETLTQDERLLKHYEGETVTVINIYGTRLLLDAAEPYTIHDNGFLLNTTEATWEIVGYEEEVIEDDA